MITILVLAAEPSDAAQLRLGEEVREIQEQLERSRERDRIRLVQRFAVRPTDISRSLLEIEPEIVHFSGHGTPDGAICVEDQAGRLQPIRADALGALFELFATRVKCVLLNACWSASQAEAISKHVPSVIGMRQAIGDRAAIAFSVGFYQALGADRSVEDSFKFGCVQISLQGIPEEGTPVLLEGRARDPRAEETRAAGLPTVRPPAVARPINLGFDGPADAGRPSGWFNSLGFVDFVSTEYEAQVVRREDVAGSCVKLSHPTALSEFGSLMQRCPATFLAGQTVRLEGVIRTEDVERRAGLWIRADGDKDFNLFFDNMSGRPIRGTTPWTHYAIDASLPSSTTWLNYGIVLVGKGTMWADDFRLRVWRDRGYWEEV